LDKKRILVIVLHFEPIGGLEIYGRQLVGILTDLGYEIEVWSIFEHAGLSNNQGIKVKYLAPEGRDAFRLYFRISNYLLAWRLAKEASVYDLVIALHPRVLPAIYLASISGKGVKYMAWAYGSDVWGKWPYLFEKGLEKAEKIVAISNFTRRSLIERMTAKANDIVLIYPPVDTKFYRPSERKAADRGAFRLLTVCRLGKGDLYKGVDIVIQALPEIQKRLGKEVIYRVIGKGEGIFHLKEVARSVGIAENVKFLGWVDQGRLLKEYQGCDIFIMPSRLERTSQGYLTGEGFGMVYAEAAACGKPVVASKHGGAAETVIDGVTGYIVDPNSIDEIVNAVNAILSNPDKAKKMGEAGRKFVEENMSMEVFRDRIEELLEDV